MSILSYCCRNLPYCDEHYSIKNYTAFFFFRYHIIPLSVPNTISSFAVDYFTLYSNYYDCGVNVCVSLYDGVTETTTTPTTYTSESQTTASTPVMTTGTTTSVSTVSTDTSTAFTTPTISTVSMVTTTPPAETTGTGVFTLRY